MKKPNLTDPRALKRRAKFFGELQAQVRRGALTQHQASVLAYRYDHPGTTVATAAAKCGIPLGAVKDMEVTS